MLVMDYIVLVWIIGIILFLYAILFVYKTKTGSPYVPSKGSQIKVMMKYVGRGDRIADMGAGDGRLLEKAVIKGAHAAWGWEIEPYVWLVGYLRLRKYRSAHLILGDMWRADLSQFDVVFVYQLERFAKRFARKCLEEMKTGSIVIANTYPLKDLPLHRRDGVLYIYKI